MKRYVLLCVVLIFGTVGCADSRHDTENVGDVELMSQSNNGKKLFKKEEFGGNGRTCETCHLSSTTGTINPEQVADLFAYEPTNALFRSIDSDDGVGSSYTRLIADATIRIPMTLPSNVIMEDDPTATQVVLIRGIPSTNNVALQDVLMYDGRETELPHQAVSAVHTHYQNTVEPTQEQADAIADFQEGLFSSNDLKKLFTKGKIPTLPSGCSDSEQRGRTFFVGDHKRGLCAQCHDGPMLNETNSFNALQPPGQKFSTNFTSELNFAGHPVHTFKYTMPDASVLRVVTPDPGRGLATGDPHGDIPLLCGFPVAPDGFCNTTFKIPTLWGISQTAPYFHDNSAKNFDDVMVQYQIFFGITAAGLNDPDLIISDQDAADIKAFMALL